MNFTRRLMYGERLSDAAEAALRTEPVLSHLIGDGSSCGTPSSVARSRAPIVAATHRDSSYVSESVDLIVVA